MLCDVVVVRRRRWAHAPVIHAASHFYREKRVARVSISMYTCPPVPIVMGLRMAALRAAGAPLQIKPTKWKRAYRMSSLYAWVIINTGSKNFAINAINFANAEHSPCTQATSINARGCEYDLTETSLIYFDSHTFFLVSGFLYSAKASWYCSHKPLKGSLCFWFEIFLSSSFLKRHS